MQSGSDLSVFASKPRQTWLCNNHWEPHHQFQEPSVLQAEGSSLETLVVCLGFYAFVAEDIWSQSDILCWHCIKDKLHYITINQNLITLFYTSLLCFRIFKFDALVFSCQLKYWKLLHHWISYSIFVNGFSSLIFWLMTGDPYSSELITIMFFLCLWAPLSICWLWDID